MQNIFSAALKPIQNKVLVEIVGKYDTSVKLGNTTIEIDKSFEKEKFISTSAIVRAVPTKLTFGKEPDDLQWKTDMQLKVNDCVTMSFMAIASAIGDKGTSFTENGKTYCFVHYRDIVYVTRNGEDIMLNGFCLVKPLTATSVEKSKWKGVIMPSVISSKFSNKFGQVILCGEPNKQYAEEKSCDDNIVKAGDTVAYVPIAGIQVYRSTQDLLTKTNVFLKIQRRYILAILDKV